MTQKSYKKAKKEKKRSVLKDSQAKRKRVNDVLRNIVDVKDAGMIAGVYDELLFEIEKELEVAEEYDG